MCPTSRSWGSRSKTQGKNGDIPGITALTCAPVNSHVPHCLLEPLKTPWRATKKRERERENAAAGFFSGPPQTSIYRSPLSLSLSPSSTKSWRQFFCDFVAAVFNWVGSKIVSFKLFSLFLQRMKWKLYSKEEETEPAEIDSTPSTLTHTNCQWRIVAWMNMPR